MVQIFFQLSPISWASISIYPLSELLSPRISPSLPFQPSPLSSLVHKIFSSAVGPSPSTFYHISFKLYLLKPIDKPSGYCVNFPSPCTNWLGSGWRSHPPAEVTKSSFTELRRRQPAKADPSGKPPTHAPAPPPSPWSTTLPSVAALVTLCYNCLHVGHSHGHWVACCRQPSAS